MFFLPAELAKVRMSVSCSVTWFSFSSLARQCNSFVRFRVKKKTSALIRCYRVMPPKSRVTQRLLAHNVSPVRESRKRSREVEVEVENRKTPLTTAQVKELVLQFGGWNPGELQIVCLIALGFTAFLRWDDLKDLRRHNLHITSDHMSIKLTKRERVLSSWWLTWAFVHALYPWPKDFYLLVWLSV